MAQTEREILDSLIPEAVIENITLETSTSGDQKGLIVRVRFTVSDVVNRDAIGQWFEQEEYEKYFKIRTLLTYYNEGYENIDDLKQISEFESIVALDAMGSETSFSYNNSINIFSFEKRYVLDVEPEYMVFEVLSSFDVEQMEQDYGIDLFSLSELASRKRKEITIFREGQLASESSVYIIAEGPTGGQVWDGPVHRLPLNPSAFATGTEPSEDSKRLEEILVTNPNVQDFRAREDVRKLVIDEQTQVEGFVQRIRAAMVKRDEAGSEVSDFISDLWVTRNSQGEAKFVFIFDAESFFKKRSQYRKYYERMTPQQKAEIIREMLVPSIKIKRKRVRVIDGLQGRSVIDFSDEETMETIVETHKREGASSFSRKITDTGAIRQINISGVGNDNLFFITGTDYSIADVTDGAYSYGVSVEFLDTTRELLLKKLKVLNDNILNLRKVYNIMILPENYNLTNNMLIRKPVEIISEYNRNRSASEGSLVNYTGFLAQFIDVVKRFAGSSSIKYVRILSNFERIKSPENLEVLISMMEEFLKMSLSDIGEPSSGFTGKNALPSSDYRISAEKFYTSPDKIFDASLPSNNGMEYLSNFSENVQEDVMREIRTLSRDAGEIGIRVIDGAQFESRINTESRKLFTSDSLSLVVPILAEDGNYNPPVPITGPGSEFLSFSAFLRPNDEPLIIRDVNDEANGRRFLSDNITAFTAETIAAIPGTPSYSPITNRKEASFLASHNVFFGESQTSKTLLLDDRGVSAGNSRASDTPDVSNIQNVYDRQEEREEAQVQKKFEEFIFSKMLEPLSSPTLGTSDTFTSSTETFDIVSNLSVDAINQNSVWSSEPVSQRRSSFEQAPNIVKSLSLLGVSPDLTRATRVPQSGTYKVNMNFLTKIQYLSGFGNENNMNTPVWASLTLDIYRNNSDRNLLCRIKPYHHERLGIRITNTKSPIFDAVFIIKPVEFFSVETGIEESMLSSSGAFISGSPAAAAGILDSKRAEHTQLVGDKIILERIKQIKEAEKERVETQRREFIEEPENRFTPTGTFQPRLTSDARFVVDSVYDPKLAELNTDIAELHRQITQKTIEIAEIEGQIEELEGFIN